MKIWNAILSVFKFFVALAVAYARGRRDGLKKSDEFIKSAEELAAKKSAEHKTIAKKKQDAIKTFYNDARNRLRNL